MSAKIVEAAALSPSSFRKRYRSSYEMPSPSSSPTLPIRKRYQGTTFDIFQNIVFPYSLNTAYCLLLDMAYWILFPSWSLVSAGTDTPYLP
ncbi:hypothetical protein Tco_1491693 [Tanacetum coccineum]